jgi:hypothetical protein
VKDTDYLAAAAALFHAFTFDRLIPLVSLALVATLFAVVLFQAQKRDDFDWSEFLRDESKKLSWGRLGAFVCLMTHSWTVFARTLNDRITVEELGLYAITWSGSLVLLQAIDAWKGKA